MVKRENEETLSHYRANQKVYNSFWDEWDCGYSFANPSAAEMEDADWSDSDEDDFDLPEVPIVPFETMSAQTTSGPPIALPSLPIVTDLVLPEVPVAAHSTSNLPPTTPPTCLQPPLQLFQPLSNLLHDGYLTFKLQIEPTYMTSKLILQLKSFTTSTVLFRLYLFQGNTHALLLSLKRISASSLPSSVKMAWMRDSEIQQ